LEGLCGVRDAELDLLGELAHQLAQLGAKLGIDLETEIDRTAFGVNWSAELPNGGPVAGNEVKLTAELELVKEA